MSAVEVKKAVVIGGKLKLKGDSGSSSKKRKIESVSVTKVEAVAAVPPVATLTEAQKRHREKQIELEAKQAKKLSSASFRDRIESFNERLAKTTEHNDIPRVSAAGNG